MDAINISKLDDYELDVFKRDIAQEIERRSKGPMRIIYQVVEWDTIRTFSDFRCAAICFADIAEQILEDASTEEGKALFDLNKGTTLYSIKPVEITLADFEAKMATKYFDDICFEKRLNSPLSNNEDKA